MNSITKSKISYTIIVREQGMVVHKDKKKEEKKLHLHLWLQKVVAALWGQGRAQLLS